MLFWINLEFVYIVKTEQMASETKNFAESATSFTKSPLGIIALFIVLVYGFATLAVTFGNNLKDHLDPLIFFLVIFPLIVFLGFLWLVAKHPDKIYGPSDFKDEKNFMDMMRRKDLSSVASLTIAAISQEKGVTVNEGFQYKVNSIIDSVSKMKEKDNKRKVFERKTRILWVDDNPENNVYERKAFEVQGVEFTLARSTDEAEEILKNNNFGAIISDMGRKEGQQEGYVLLQKVRDLGHNTPFYIYAGSNAPEHKKMALEKGAQGCTNNPEELYSMVMSRLFN